MGKEGRTIYLHLAPRAVHPFTRPSTHAPFTYSAPPPLACILSYPLPLTHPSCILYSPHHLTSTLAAPPPPL